MITAEAEYMDSFMVKFDLINLSALRRKKTVWIRDRSSVTFSHLSLSCSLSPSLSLQYYLSLSSLFHSLFDVQISKQINNIMIMWWKVGLNRAGSTGWISERRSRWRRSENTQPARGGDASQTSSQIHVFPTSIWQRWWKFHETLGKCRGFVEVWLI